MKQGKKWTAILLSLLMLVSLFAGCGGGEIADDPVTADPNLGLYKLYNLDGMSVEDYAELMGMDLEEARNSFTVELLSKGKAKMTSDGDGASGTWELDGEKFILKETGASYEGTLKNGVMTIDIGGSVFMFSKDGKTGSGGAVSAPTESEAETEPSTEAAPTEAVSKYTWWEGEWFGWWSIIEGEGDYEQYGIDGSSWDCYATITVNPDDTGEVTLWYSGNYKSEPMVSGKFHFMEGLSERGALILDSGEMFPAGNWNLGRTDIGSMEMEYGDWYVDPAESTVTQFEEMIEIAGHYTDPDSEEDNFEYRIYLRPWGMRWEDVEEGDTSDCVYDDMMPIHYEEWYLPLVELGYPGAPDSYDEGADLIEDEEPYEPGAPIGDDGGETEFVPTALDPDDKEGATGEVDMETLRRCLDWCKWDTSYSTSYEEVAAQFGVHGHLEDCPFEGKTIYRWWAEDEMEHYIKITFDVHEDGSETWNVTQWDGID